MDVANNAVSQDVANVDAGTETGMKCRDCLLVIYITCFAYLHIIVTGSGCWFGNPKGEDKVWMPNITEEQLLSADSSPDPGELGRSLMALVFTAEELKWGNCTDPRTPGVTKLNSVKLRAIRGNYNSHVH